MCLENNCAPSVLSRSAVCAYVSVYMCAHVFVHMCLCTREGAKEKESNRLKEKDMKYVRAFFNFPLFILHSYYTQFCQEE